MKTDLTGARFGRLTVLKPSEDRAHYMLCRCDCGAEREIYRYSLLNGDTQSCGCFRRERTVEHRTTHGLTGTPEHRIWLGMLRRCSDTERPDFANYGGRGIKVCDRWRESFATFLADMGPKPSPKHSIERINNDGDYEPGNCIWATRDVQNANTRKNHYLTLGGETHHLAEWSRRTGIGHADIINRLARGWSIERTLTELPKVGRRPGPRF